MAGALAVCCLNACVAHYTRVQQTPDDYRHLPAAANANWRYSAGGPVELQPVEKTLRRHDAIPLSYPSSGVNEHAGNLVQGEYLRSRLPGPKKLLVVLPIWGSSMYPSQKDVESGRLDQGAIFLPWCTQVDSVHMPLWRSRPAQRFQAVAVHSSPGNGKTPLTCCFISKRGV